MAGNTRARPRLPRRLTAVLAAICLTLAGLAVLPTAQAQPNGGDARKAADQVLTWTAGDALDEYSSAPETAVAGPATFVFENSAETGNTTGMQHTLTFTTSDPDYNQDVSVNILAGPNDADGGRHEVEVELTPGVYHYHCTIPGHFGMEGELVVTEDDGGGGEDTTPPEVSASVEGEQDADGAYLGSATATLTATDDSSGVDSVEYALDDAGFAPYEEPVAVTEPGDHTLAFRATDVAGNVSEEDSVEFTVVAPPGDDTTPPEVSASVEGEQDADGAYVGMATVAIEASDAESGVATTEYALGGEEFTEYEGPFMVHAAGEHTVAYRAVDNAGNSSETHEITFTVVEDGGGDPDPECAETDDRPVVFVGEQQTDVPNRENADGCTVNEVIEDERAWTTPNAFRGHVRGVTRTLAADGVIDADERRQILDAADSSGIGEGDDEGYEKLFDGTQASFEKWEHVGGGGFDLNEDGTMTSSSETDGMGMLWYPDEEFGDYSLKLQFRDDAPGDGRANSGVLTRFPNVHEHPEESRPEWVAVKYGHEIQINDAPGGDQYKTGSVYGFDLVDHAGGLPTPKGEWNDYEIRVVGQTYAVYRNGTLINEFRNAPGQHFSPPRDDDPGTDGRQNDTGYVGLQAHSTSDVTSFRDVRIKPLS